MYPTRPSTPPDHFATRWHAVRRPMPPAPIETYDLTHPAVPPELDGLTILHLTDLHIRRSKPFTPIMQQLLFALEQTPVDLILLTGDYSNRGGDEESALQTLAALSSAWQTRLGAFAIYGNHDTPIFIARRHEITGITWLGDTPLDLIDAPIRLFGANWPEDLPALVTSAPPLPTGVLPLTLIHYPSELPAQASFGLPVSFAGHTHGGQFRMGTDWAPHTSCDVPGNMAAGILRVGDSLCAVSRGLGDAVLQMRLLCKPHAPLYTLRRGPLPPLEGAERHRMRRIMAW